jgi:hypothetical protein
MLTVSQKKDDESYITTVCLAERKDGHRSKSGGDESGRLCFLAKG